ncbi:MAG: 4Fe-4S dicluster domain-containing protein [Candidatus Nanopelagicales bacterium]|nr:4Fe-4S dicluster domain-containing protein [Candidatus Nanopelagicales bacterium]
MPTTRPVAEDGVDRRSFVRTLTGMGAGTLAVAVAGGGLSQILSAPPAEATSTERKFRYGMVIDTQRCVGCKACTVACKVENKTPPGVYYTVVVTETNDSPEDKPLYLTKPCFHCENPPCVKACPVSATFKREQDGIVVVDYQRCIGCRYCITACPYGARYFDFGDNYPQTMEGGALLDVPSPEYNQYIVREPEKSPIGNVRKCTFCLHQQDEEGRYDKKTGRWPACAKTCTGHAIHFGDFNDRNSEVSVLLRERQAIRLKEELGTEPNVYYLL